MAASSSSSVAASSAHKLGLWDRSLTVHMPGGKLAIEISTVFCIVMTDAVTKVADGVLMGEVGLSGTSE